MFYLELTFNPLHANFTAVELRTRKNYKVPRTEAPSIEMSLFQRVNKESDKYVFLYFQAIKRLKERNGLSEQAAKDRLASQPTNTEQVTVANVVFSSQWSYEFTTAQVQRAWDNLLHHLEGKKAKSNI